MSEALSEALSPFRPEMGGTVVVETRYAAGDGLLLGSGDHWLLVTDPGDEAVVDRLWDALTQGSGSAAAVLDAVESAFGGEPPGLVLVDLTPGTGQTVSLGSGRVRVEGPTRLVSLGTPPDDPGPLRPLLGGVVAARHAVIRPVGDRSVAPATGPHAQAAPVGAPPAGLIDGIPQSILHARGPDGPPPPRPRVSRLTTVADSGPRETIEPDPLLMERVVAPAAEVTASTPVADEHPATTGSVTGSRTGAHTGAHTEPGTPADHGGATVFRSGGPGHLSSTTGTTVQAVWCPDGHLTPPDSPLCRVCRSQVAPQAAQRVPRPTLGGLRLPTGEVVPLDRGVVLGRRPAPVPGTGDWPHLVHLPAEHTYVSRMHVQLELDGWLVIARDLGSRGGTTWKVPGQAPERMVPNESYVLEPGHALDLADVYEVRYVVGPEATFVSEQP